MRRYFVVACVGFSGLALAPIAAREPLAARIVHTDPSKYRHEPGGTRGAGYAGLYRFVRRPRRGTQSAVSPSRHNRAEERNWRALSQSLRRDVRDPRR